MATSDSTPAKKTDAPSHTTSDLDKPGAIDPNSAAVFRDGDPAPTNAKSKSITGKALEMTMGFDCNGVAGNPGDTVFFFNDRCIIIPAEPEEEDTSK